ncbi:hypothetical protein CDV55_102387 [Aspergillus turcosus]|uniref:Restriction endonuclease domain-containing protein n=1 Tax=Aspergillus turcosus TaxID=1245748 RepID=A0A229X4F6_9EURO|nr:hypothetical protein CDV55_102387 [Aspergillus turcosus]RLL95175.1 hypothetical protein CFD26_104084 [Aspergillus turcosus]
MEELSDQRPRRPGLRSETSAKAQSEAVWPQLIHHPASEYQTEQHMFTHILKEIKNTKFPAEITYHSVPSEWGALIADHIDKHEYTESSNAKVSFNNIAKKLVIRIMPTRVHACHNDWVHRVYRQWIRQNLVTLDHLDNIRTFTDNTQERFAAPYANSRKIPDLCIMPDNQYQPSFVIEVGWSESHERLMDDMKLWMEGGAPYVKNVLIIKWAMNANTKEVRGKAELYARDPAGNPYCSQQSVLFPATITGNSLYITAGDLFGPLLPQGVAATTLLPLSMDILRQEARDAMVHMGVTPKP